MSARAKAVGLPVNVMDDLAHSTFIFPAIVDRGDVVVAVGTGGTSPVVARRVRERIEAVLPARIGDLAAFIGRWRKPIHGRIAEFALRRRFWERVVDGPIGALVLAGRTDEAEAALKEIADPSAFAGAQGDGKAEGRVTLVGAGPGDPDLLTVKALRALQDADVVFYDELVSPEILDRARRDASRVPGRPPRRQARHRPGRHQQIADRGREIRPARGAAEGRRLLRVRPRRRGSRSAAQGRYRLFGRSRHYRGARRGGTVRSAADLPPRGAAHHLPHRAQGERRRNRRLVDADGREDDGRGLYGHDRGAVGPRRPSGRGPLAANPGRRVRAGDAGRMRRPWSARSTGCPIWSSRSTAVPPFSSSATWSRIPRHGAIPTLIKSSPNYWKLPNDLSP